MVKKIITALFFFSLFSFSVGSSAEVNVRVEVKRNISDAEITIGGRFRIYEYHSGTLLKKGKALGGHIVPKGPGISIANIPFTAEAVRISAEDSAINIDGRDYKGDIVVLPADAKLTLVNHIDLEDYTKGVLYHEASHFWPMEVLKAQAIAVRTYALYTAGINASAEFDLRADVYSQVYGGATSERGRTNRAVESTRSMVLRFNGKILPAFFHATCGGHTEDASHLWKVDIPPLDGVQCPFCELSPHFKWNKSIPLHEVQRALNNNAIPVREIKVIVALGRSASGRNKTILVKDKFKEFRITAGSFRLFIGPNEIRSTNFSIRIEDGYVVFDGLGWGHGVGLCQWGGYFMSKQGRSFREILEYYYPQAEIEKLN